MTTDRYFWTVGTVSMVMSDNGMYAKGEQKGLFGISSEMVWKRTTTPQRALDGTTGGASTLTTPTAPGPIVTTEPPSQPLMPSPPPSGQGSARTGEARTALVIGNSSYPTIPLRTPENDARALSASLRKLGFDITLIENGRRRDMITAIEDFGRKLRSKAGVGLVFYAGHGLQMKGRNYLIPVDAQVGSEVSAVSETVDLELVLGTMAESGTRINVVILDACRDNPFERRFRGAGRGLAPMSVSDAKGTLIAYSTDPGKTAVDGDGNHSPYAQALIEALPLPGLSIEQVFKHVRRQVQDLTSGAQTPWETSNLTGEFSFTAGIH